MIWQLPWRLLRIYFEPQHRLGGILCVSTCLLQPLFSILGALIANLLSDWTGCQETKKIQVGSGLLWGCHVDGQDYCTMTMIQHVLDYLSYGWSAVVF